MQNFKQFLTEDTSKKISVFRINFKLSSNVTKQTELMQKPENIIQYEVFEIAKEKLPELNFVDTSYLKITKNLIFQIEITKENSTKLEEITKELFSVAEQLFGSNNIKTETHAILYNIEQQDYLVKCDLIKLSFDKTRANSLLGIAKKLDCITLETWNIGHVEQGGLGLLAIKRLKHIICVTIDGDIKWLKIIRQHLDRDKDILDCQEELISNGLKDYAKL